MVRIDAAASVAYVVENLSQTIEQRLNVRLEVNAGASGALAQQVAHGRRSDLFLSADPRWLDWLGERGLIDPATRVDLASNRLVVIGGPSVEPINGLAVLADEKYQPLAVGDAASVPAGRYALEALEANGLDTGKGLRLAEASDVRAALAFVKSGECPAGIVYASDLRGAEGVSLLFEIDPADHEPVRYPAAVLSDAPNGADALRVLAWLRGKEARAAFEGAGFGVVEDQ